MSKYKAYPSYKDSGTDWLRDVPSEWDVVRNKQVFSFEKHLVGKRSKNYTLLSLTLQGIKVRDIESGKGKFPAEFDTYQVVEHNDIIFCLFDIDETPRTIGLSNYRGMITGAYNVARCNTKSVPKYIYYYYLSIDEYKGLKPFYTGLRKVVRTETFLNIPLALPSLQEQQTIANYLDTATAKIDTLIAKQTKLIELLAEKRQAVISTAVTRGLDSTVAMKESGVAWLGEIPEGWGSSPLKFLLLEPLLYGANESADRNNPCDPRYIRITDIKTDGTLHNDTFRSLPMEIAQPYLLKNNSLLLVRSGATVGKTFLYDDSWGVACFAGYLIKATMLPTKVNAKFVSYFTKTTNYWQWLHSSQIKATIENVSAEKYANLVIPLPSIEEQQIIVNHIDQKTQTIDTLISKATQAIALLKERRTALISAVVTGKVKVNGEAREDALGQDVRENV